MPFDDPHELRRAFGRYMTGVTVVTTRTPAGEPLGFTANSFTSVSLEPPLLLICPGRQLSSFAAFERCEHFCVNVLAEAQEAVAAVFAKAGADRFSQIDWKDDPQGCPLLEGVAATFSCHVHRRVDAGDHLVLIGEVLQFEQRPLRGLGYCSEGYFSLDRERRADAASAVDERGFAGALIECGDALLVANGGDGYRLPTLGQKKGAGAFSTLSSYCAESGLDVSWGPVYSIYEEGGHRYTFLRARSGRADATAFGEFVPLAALRPDDFPDAAQRALLTRFLVERADGCFGLYVGDAERGEVHPSTC